MWKKKSFSSIQSDEILKWANGEREEFRGVGEMEEIGHGISSSKQCVTGCVNN